MITKGITASLTAFAGLFVIGCSLVSDTVTMAQYESIRDGMSYEEVTQIVGTPGEENARNHLDGVEGVMGSIETVMYSWQNPDGSNMNAMFQNNRLVQKAQYGLD